MTSPKKGAATSVFLATSNIAAEQNGAYFEKCKPSPTSALAKDFTTEEYVIKESFKLIQKVIRNVSIAQ